MVLQRGPWLAWLRCQVTKGLWGGEYSVIVNFEFADKPQQLTTWADKSEVKVLKEPAEGEIVDGFLRVLVIKEDAVSKLATIRLPHETFNSGPIVVVPSGLIEQEPTAVKA